MLVRAVEVLIAGGCSPVVVPVPSDLLPEARDLFAGVEDIVLTAGGPTRQASVAGGLDEVAAERVVIHDAARPLATVSMVRDVLAALDRFDGAVTAIPVEDTLKRAIEGVVDSTVDRDLLWQVQTPQAFRTEVLRRAHETAARAGFLGTDDASLIERLGGKVAVVPGARSNMKVTYREDLSLAEAMLAARG